MARFVLDITMQSLFVFLLFPLLAAAQYHEQLVLRPLPLSALLASFNFRANTTIADFEAHNYRLFPRSLAQILQHAGTRELHLRFGLGRWDAESWGARPWDGTREGGTGVELWAWLDASTDEEADRKWLTLTNALSGLFCASLNFIDGTRTTRPVMSFQPEGDHPNVTAANMHLLYGTLPREVVCTENLTPFLKLLPCKGKAGIASLLDGHKLFDASWQSMAIDVRPVCSEDGGCVLEIEQTIDMVLDLDRAKRPRDNPIPRPPPSEELKCDTTKEYHNEHTCFPADYTAHQDWTLSKVFGRSMQGSCPLANSDVPPVCMQIPESRSVYTSEGVHEIKNPDGRSRCFKVDDGALVELVLAEPSQESSAHPESPGADFESRGLLKPEVPALYAERSLTGHGAERGGVQTIFTNPSPDKEIEFVYMESLPWFMRIYLHTLTARVADSEIDSRGSTVSAGQAQAKGDKKVIQEIYYRPALDRARGSQVEVRMRVPPASTVFLTYDFEKSILRYTEYPPDANRGFDVASAVVTILNSNQSSSTSSRNANLRTASVLLSLPTPDFSMPYNVIILSSTAIALGFGGLFNILVRRFVGADEGPRPGLANGLARLKQKIKDKFGANKTPGKDDAPTLASAGDQSADGSKQQALT
ncbi:hypothetical protein MCOR23_005078 [Pyricularia oryzae]|nr:hypothetical protein MCOR23_005078 [Pyricularia oryzae]